MAPYCSMGYLKVQINLVEIHGTDFKIYLNKNLVEIKNAVYICSRSRSGSSVG